MRIFKSIMATAILLISFSVSAQSSDAKFTHTQVVDASADKVWTVLRQMDDIDKYSSAIAKVEWTGDKGVGGARVCTAPEGQGFYKESIVAFDDNARTYSYALIEGVPVKGMVNSFKVIDLGYQKSMVVWTSNYEAFMKNPQMTEEQFGSFIKMSIGEMVANVAKAAK
ncbi:SRPBCC family protein [Neolewinella persica]|uniref:SRPBCC family protein n=1 Tax=Neolewinella persica TaxID=70998 RepID=UPI00035C493C|nr:SRPBCC family protein [Neolewinella persica]